MQLIINGKERGFSNTALNFAKLLNQLALHGKRLAVECHNEIFRKNPFLTNIGQTASEAFLLDFWRVHDLTDTH